MSSCHVDAKLVKLDKQKDEMPLPRKKACAECRASKARCNRVLPECSRCLDRGLKCDYNDTRTRPPRRSEENHKSLACSHKSHLGLSQITTPSILNLSECNVEPAIPEEWMSDLVDNSHWTPDLRGCAMMDLLETSATPQLDFLSLQNEDDESQALMSRSGLPKESITGAADSTLSRRETHKRCPLTSIVMGQVFSYPKMLTVGDQLPPFIHPPCHIDEELAPDCVTSDKHVCLPQSLAICASLVKTFDERSKATENYVWSSIYAEVDRLDERVLNNERSSASDRLAALQSLAVFLILQAEDPSSAQSNGVETLISRIALFLVDVHSKHEWMHDVQENRPNRREWVFRESVRRLILLIGITDILLEGVLLGQSHSCYSFDALPLCSTRDLWQARTNKEWRAAFAHNEALRQVPTVLTAGDLAEAQEAGCFLNDRQQQSSHLWSELIRWCDGLDALGTLVWMAMPFHLHHRSLK